MEHNIEFKREYRVDSLDLKRFDIFIPSMNKVIELDGVQHFDPSKGFGFASRTFDEIVYADNIKSKHCDDNGIDMLRIPQELVSNGYGVLDEKRCEKILHAFVFENTIDKQVVGFYKNLSFSEYGKMLHERQMHQDPILSMFDNTDEIKKQSNVFVESLSDPFATIFDDADTIKKTLDEMNTSKSARKSSKSPKCDIPDEIATDFDNFGNFGREFE